MKKSKIFMCQNPGFCKKRKSTVFDGFIDCIHDSIIPMDTDMDTDTNKDGYRYRQRYRYRWIQIQYGWIQMDKLFNFTWNS